MRRHVTILQAMWRDWLIASVAVVATGCSVTPTVAPPAAAPAAVHLPATLVGTWQRRDAYLVVGPTGSARLRWRTDWCGPGIPEPCDREVADGVLLGAHAEMTFDANLRGAISSVDPVGLFSIGPVRLVRVGPDVVELQENERTLELCRPPRDLNFCGALM